MSTWRRKATALFPELAKELPPGQDARHEFFWQLSLRAAEAHKRGDEAVLRRIHGFAEWSLHQGEELWRNAAIGFYEDVFATVPWNDLVPWLSPFVIEQIKRTWALGTQGERSRELDELVRARRNAAYQTHAFSTGEIDRL
jgi:hypothetical protein